MGVAYNNKILGWRYQHLLTSISAIEHSILSNIGVVCLYFLEKHSKCGEMEFILAIIYWKFEEINWWNG